jgi:hypothetical protein
LLEEAFWSLFLAVEGETGWFKLGIVTLNRRKCMGSLAQNDAESNPQGEGWREGFWVRLVFGI